MRNIRPIITVMLLITVVVSALPIVVASPPPAQPPPDWLITDINYDGKVDVHDVFSAAIAYGSYPGHPNWNVDADIDDSGKIDIRDIFRIAMNFGKGPVERITIADSTASLTPPWHFRDNVTIPYPLKKIVVINPAAAEIIRALNRTDRVVGISGTIRDNPDYWPELCNKTVVCEYAHGKWEDPDYARLFELNETVGGIDAVFHYGTHPAVRTWIQELAERIDPIPVIGIDCYKFSTMYDDIETLGVIFGRRKSATDKIIAFFEEIMNRVGNRTSGIPDEDKTRTYFAHHSGLYTTSNKKGTLGQILTKSGCCWNIFHDEPGPSYFDINPIELWYENRNPQMVLKDTRTFQVPLGFGYHDEAPIQAYLDDIYHSAEVDGWDTCDAVVNGRVYLLSQHLTAGPKKYIAVLYVAKFGCPELFDGIDPDEYLQRYLTEFQHLECADNYPEVGKLDCGIFMYPYITASG